MSPWMIVCVFPLHQLSMLASICGAAARHVQLPLPDMAQTAVGPRRSDQETEQRVAAKLAARRAALERGIAAQTRAAVAAVAAQHGHECERSGHGRRSLHPSATDAAMVSDMLRPRTPICRCRGQARPVCTNLLCPAGVSNVLCQVRSLTHTHACFEQTTVMTVTQQSIAKPSLPVAQLSSV